ncbi:7882_t:CDS:2 [Paraglomus occultum]|uniref:7882_t:CDS:1 n=1 Tax=Paraglomus occultum TaxID=144539 RepID=A0A9N9FHZ8_9GLOM|nr:7882_t:CDS:2 [Paraglomus occultum]
MVDGMKRGPASVIAGYIDELKGTWYSILFIERPRERSSTHRKRKNENGGNDESLWRVYSGVCAEPMNRPKSVFMWGPSRTGKTIWARSHGRHIYWMEKMDLATWDDQAQYIALDDFPWEFMPGKKSFPFGGSARNSGSLL